VFPQRVSHSASTASSQARNSALGAAPGVGASGDHALGCSLAVTREAGDERGVGQDRRAQERVVRFPRRLEGSQECVVRLLRLTQIEELDAPGKEIGLGQR